MIRSMSKWIPPLPTMKGRTSQRSTIISRKWLLIAGLLVGAETFVVARRRGSLFSVDTVVRCRRGHLSTTWWIPGVSIKAIRLGWWRFQRCPVGPHWSLVTPVWASDLTGAERESAALHHDVRIP
jgi:hypothetical protein